ncbi:hypothetical protein PLICRDRAFT_126403 [Plicaturopsis crispa FD-325 SS-3]|nr:hypothetical protein PLICRDRAFT_126403 [Plicaturopsis crispa FD-325 SS-3]
MATSQDKLFGRKIVVIGGSSGIGFGVAQAVYSLGAHVIISSSNSQKVSDAVARAKAAPTNGGTVEGIQLEGLDEVNVGKLFSKVGKFDHLVYTAGDALAVRGLHDTPVEGLKDVFNVRFWGGVSVAKVASPYISQQGSITLTGGMYVQRPPKGWAVTNAAAGANETLTRGLAVDLAPVRVNIVEAGAIRTELWNPFPEAVREKILSDFAEKTLVKRVGEVEDTTEAFLYFMRAGFVTGTYAVVDGGALLN